MAGPAIGAAWVYCGTTDGGALSVGRGVGIGVIVGAALSAATGSCGNVTGWLARAVSVTGFVVELGASP
ncbi:MAG: hypothetical protein QM775_14460 [Pirellulales bacterium]